MVDDIR
jgi:hypothetical protein